MVLKLIFFPVEGHQDAVYLTDEILRRAVVETVVGIFHLDLTDEPPASGDAANVKDVVFVYHASRVMRAPSALSRVSMCS